MCLVFVAWRAHPRYRLIVAANRDEYHARPTAPAAPWDDEPDRAPDGGARAAAREAEPAAGTKAPPAHPPPSGGGESGQRILAGRDLLAGGTWLGVTPEGRFAALTNVRGSTPPGPDAPSRGRLAVDFLRNRLDARFHARAVAREAGRYSGFNLLLGARDGLFCVSNRGGGGLTELSDGFHGLGNGRLNAPEPKVTGGIAELRRLIRTDFDRDGLFALLADDVPAPEAESAGNGLERARSARFIRGDVYGTRSSTVLTIDRSGAIAFEERSFDARTVETGRVVFASPSGVDPGFTAIAATFSSGTIAAG